MNISITDPLLTAYALGECDEADRTRIEAAIAADAELSRTVDEIRSAGKLLIEELASEQGTGLPEAHRARINRALSKPRVRILRLRYLVPTLATAAAAVLAVALQSHSQQQENISIVRRTVESVKTVTETPATENPPIDETEPRVEIRFVSSKEMEQLLSEFTVERVQENTEVAVLVAALDNERVFANPHVATGIYKDLNGLNGDIRIPGDRDILGEVYEHAADSAFASVRQAPLSTMSIDVDSASYANVRRFINAGRLPPPDAVRVEEMLNYFTYHDPAPSDDRPFSVNVEVAGCPWNSSHRLARIGLKGKDIARESRPASNLVFLIDVSGSMREANKLPLVKSALIMLVEQLNENDRVSIVTYAGTSGLHLAPTSGSDKRAIIKAIDDMKADGSTNGGAGIQLAYDTAKQHFLTSGVNRVILATDGDFNVGITGRGDLTALIQQEAKTGTFLSVLGFGMGNVKDATMEQLADKGNGNYAYIDTLLEARKVLVEQMQGTLMTIAKDVKVQVEFNPAQVDSYRLIGYENRVLAKQDFNDDHKDAGEIGAGHSVTALYEIVPAGGAAVVETLKYQPQAPAPKKIAPENASGELMTVKLRYKDPAVDTSKLIELPVTDKNIAYADASYDFKWAAAVASFGMLMRNSPYAGNSNLDTVLELAHSAAGADTTGYRAEFLELVAKARKIVHPTNWGDQQTVGPGLLVPDER
jgi:Ca-activated chloride channel homolog